MQTWTFDQARALIVRLEARLPDIGCHVGLTGGVLYKEGQRKDLDLIIYRIRQCPDINDDKLIKVFEDCGVTIIKKFGWMYKARCNGRGIDILIPESSGKDSDKYPSVQEGWVHNLIEFESGAEFEDNG